MWLGWDQLTPVLRYANFYDAEAGGGFGPRYIQEFQLLSVQSGTGAADIESEHFDIGPGDVLYYGPHARHTVRSSHRDPLHLIGLVFLFCQSDLVCLDVRLPHARSEPFDYPRGIPSCPLRPLPPAKTSLPRAGTMRAHCESLALSRITASTGRELEQRGLLLLVLQDWHDALCQEDARASFETAPYRRAIMQAQDAILTNLAQPPTAAQLARAMDVHPDYFTRLFRRQTGMSVRQFVTYHRMRQAQRLLVEGQSNVGEVAAAVGFSDPYYFSRLFTRQVGVAPSVFRKEHALA